MPEPSTSIPAPLGYASRGTVVPRRRWVHVWALPLLWLPGGIGACFYYGDEYSAFGAAHLPVVLVLDSTTSAFNDIDLGMIVVVVLGTALMTLTGMAMDVLRVSRWIWLGMIVVVVAAAVIGVWSITPKWWAQGEASLIFFTMFFVAWCWGLYFLAGGALAVAAMVRLVRSAARARLP